MNILHELNQLEMGGAERVVAGIIKHDNKNKHTVFSYKDGPMRQVLEKAGARVILEKDGETPNVALDLIHTHTGGAESLIINSVKGVFPAVETIHSPVTSKIRDEYLVKRIGVSNLVTKKNRNCVTIHNGVDTDRLFKTEFDKEFYKNEFGIPKDSFVVGRVGRIAMDKCLEEFLVACWKFQNLNPNEKIYVLIAGGETDPGYLAKVKVMAASLPLKNVVFVGETEYVENVYKAMDVFLYPSPTEGFGLVFFEAMVCGVPVITWNNELTRELLYGAASLAKPSVDSLVKHLDYYFLSETSRVNCASFAQSYALESFTERRMSQDYQLMYESLDIDVSKEFAKDESKAGV